MSDFVRFEFLLLCAVSGLLWGCSFYLVRTARVMKHCIEAQSTRIENLSRSNVGLRVASNDLVLLYRKEQQRSAALLGTVRALRRELRELNQLKATQASNDVSAAAEAQRLVAQEYGPSFPLYGPPYPSITGTDKVLAPPIEDYVPTPTAFAPAECYSPTTFAKLLADCRCDRSSCLHCMQRRRGFRG